MTSLKQHHERVTNIPNLKNLTPDERADLLKNQSSHNNNVLLLPALYREFLPRDNGEAPAMDHILAELAQADYIDHIVLGLDAATEENYHDVVQRMSILPQKTHILWNSGPRLMDIHNALDAENLAPKELGKGRNVWYCLGYVQGLMKQEGMEPDQTVIALHDCDIVTYDRDLPTKLFLPMAIENSPFDYAKGYYARHDGKKLNGRTTRLFIAPMLHALDDVFQDTAKAREYVDFVDAFQYPLSGEMAFRGSILGELNMPFDWGLEIGLLSDIYEKKVNVADIEIADNYDHKHQEFVGLEKMVREISKAFFRKLAAEGAVITSERVRTLQANYQQHAESIVPQFQAAALCNGLGYNRGKEHPSIQLFAKCIGEAFETFQKEPLDVTSIPQWNVVTSSFPKVTEQMLDAVANDRNDVVPSQTTKKPVWEPPVTQSIPMTPTMAYAK